MSSPIDLLASTSSAALQAAEKPSKPEAQKPVKPSKRKRKPLVRYAKLHGSPPSNPRGRHAVARSDTSDEDADARPVITIPINQRLGFRLEEFAAALGISYTTVWRHIRDKKIPTVVVGGVTLIPRKYAVELGLISEDDNIAESKQSP